MFMTEVLNKSLQEGEPDDYLYDYLHRSLVALDTLTQGLGIYPIQFLLGLAQQLGFGVQTAAELYAETATVSANPEALQAAFEQIATNGYGTDPKLPKALRQQLLDQLLYFYRYHIENWGELRSLAILKELI